MRLSRDENKLMSFSFVNATKGNLSSIDRLPFSLMKDKILGKKYDLTLVFVSTKEIRRLNKQYRKKDFPTDILSFKIDNGAGEILMNETSAKKEAKKFEREYFNFLQFLFIHGCLHLKGFTHGSRMESEERKFRNKFGI